MLKSLIFLLLIPFTAFPQQRESWIEKPASQWPSIAMINEVWYKNGERYIHPSFEYAATGFLIATETDTLAATVKHVLWVAKTKSMNSVDMEGNLKKWIMHPKGNLQDSVIIDQLINRDTAERLEGPQSSITQRDWLVFTTKYVSPNIQPLRPRFTPVMPGERIWYLGCPYNDSLCIRVASKVVDVEGNRIIFSMPDNINLGGASGSAIIDENGFLIAILGGSTMVRYTGEPALYGVSTRYLQKVLNGERPLNTPLIPIGTVLKAEIEKNGIEAGIDKYIELRKDKKNFFYYDFTFEDINKTADHFLSSGKTRWAIALYKLSIGEFPIGRTYHLLAKAYEANNELELAIEACQKAISLQPGNQEAIETLKRLTKEN